VRILRRFEANNTAYFVMPYLPGRSLKQVIEEQVTKGEAFTELKLKDLLNPMLDALQTLHAAGVYHRDIKAANIMLVKGHRPILIDFGAARQVISEKSHTIVESAGFTPFEQLQSHGNVGPWSDIYALSATFYTAIHGEAPPRASDRIRRDPILKLADQYSDVYSRPFLAALDWALAVDETERPQSVEAWREALNGRSSDATTRVIRPPALPPKREPAPVQREAPKPPALTPPPKPAEPFSIKFVLTLVDAAAMALLILAVVLHLIWPMFEKPGSLHVVSDPPQAKVQIPGQSDATTPADFPSLRVGKHTVTISAPGYDPITVTVDIKEATAYPLDTVQLQRALGTLILQATPARVNYRLIEKDDPNARELRGVTPTTLTDLPSGAYELTLSASGLDSRTISFDVPAHQTTTQARDLVKLDVCGDSTSPAAKALLGQIPVEQLDENGKKEYADLLTQAINSYLHYDMFAQADDAAEAMKMVGHDTEDVEKKIATARNNFEQETSEQISDLIDDKRLGAATSKLKALKETLPAHQSAALVAKFQSTLAPYQLQSADAIQQAQSGDPATAYDALKTFGDQHSDDVQVQIALGKLLTRMPPDHDRLGARIESYKDFRQQYLGNEEAAELQEMQTHLQTEFDTYNDLVAKANAEKAGPSGLQHRIAVLQDEIADNERKAASGEGVDKAVNAVTGLFGQHVHVTSAAERRADIEREQAELNQDLATQQNVQPNSTSAQDAFNAFCAKVPW
jgi:hypothetical protein